MTGRPFTITGTVDVSVDGLDLNDPFVRNEVFKALAAQLRETSVLFTVAGHTASASVRLITAVS